MRTPVLRLAAALVVAGLALGGCGDDDPEGRSGPTEPTSFPVPTIPTAPPTGVDDAAAGAAATLVETGLGQVTSGDTATAKVTFANALELDPTNIYALYNLGLIAQQEGDEEGAIVYYDAGLAVDATYAPALFNRAILDETRDLDAAIERYRAAVEQDPTLAAAYVRLGFALIETGETEEGDRLRQQGIDLDPNLADVEAPTYE